MSKVLEPAAPTRRETVPTVVTRIRAHAEATPDRVALREKRFGIWQDITWADYWEQIQLVAHGLLSLGIQPGDRVAVHSENRPEWLFADGGALAAGAVSVGLYPTNPAAEVRHILHDSGARVLVAEDQEQVDKALAVRADVKSLEWIIYLEPRGVRSIDDATILSWTAFLDRGRAHREAHPDALDALAADVVPDDISTLVYTSGTTGPPKGAMLSVGNVNYAIDKLITEGVAFGGPVRNDDVSVSYLPMCHVAERIFTQWTNAASGHQVHFAESIDTVQQNLAEVQPTIFFAVPRIWEKIHASIEIKMSSASLLKRANYRFWMRQADHIGRELADNGGTHTWRTRLRYSIGYPFLFRSLRDRIGLRKCRFAGSGAAPISPEILRWFFGIGVVIYELYGMTENLGVATSNKPGRVKLGTVGEPQPNIELRIDEQTGEILTRHPAVFAGYWNRPDATADTIDADGWLHSGDVGEWVDGTHVRIVDRIKDIIITAGGKNLSPSEIENALKFSPFIREADVIGDKRPYLVALIGIELDVVCEWAQQRRIPFTTYRDLSEKPEVLTLIQGVIKETNERFARVENIRKFRIIPKELDHEDGELTATQKVKRAALAKMFEPLIEDMYGNRKEFAGGDLTEVHGARTDG
ncbi:MAG TPA: AMP-binding protein [Actinomycetota bacterium]|jgi:long-chain acyl-CoA synthetase|nr:AMP-binding protein [Actinomycetota bacterium]